jgi:asparagine synthetase B (glutamine-hydrolysing)
VGLRCELDVVAWAQLLAYEFTLGDQTPLAGVKLVPASSTLELPLAGGERLHRRWRFRLEPSPNGDTGELAEELRRLTASAVAERLDDNTVLALSGGLDSRTMLSALIGDSREVLLVSYGVPGSDDLRLAEAVATAAGLPHRTLPLEPGYLTRGAEESVWLAEGSIRCLHSHHLALRSVRNTDGARAVLMGFAGDAVFRAYAWSPRSGEVNLPAALHGNLAGCISDDLIDTLLTPAFANSVRGVALDSLRAHFAEEEGDDVLRVRQFVWNHGLRRKVYPGALLFADDLITRDPFADPELIEFCRRMPESLRQDGVLQRASLNASPQLTALPSPKDGLPPRLQGRRRRLSLRVVRARRRTRAQLEATLGFHWLPNRSGIADYADDLRTHGRPLLDVLLEPRTLARGQVREEGVRKLVDELLAGRRRNTRPLGMLLTLELFQRQFIDERPPE